MQETFVDTPLPAAPYLGDTVPPLENGDRLTRPEFERRYDAMPHLKKAELIEGVVHMAAAARLKRHGGPQRDLITWLGVYSAATLGVDGADNTSDRLDLDNEPQPDGLLYIEPECGGQATISEDDYLEGAPELIGEVAASSASYDLGPKLNAYRRNGVKEYVVWRVLDKEIDWFVLREGRYQRQPLGDDGIYRSEVFPGLWLDKAAMLRRDLAQVLKVLQQGLVSEEHEQFVARLASAKVRKFG
jgi:Uma2 family endonuclease